MGPYFSFQAKLAGNKFWSYSTDSRLCFVASSSRFLAHLAYMPMSPYNHDSWFHHYMGSWSWWRRYIWCLFMFLLARVLIAETLYLEVYHIMSPIDAHEIFSQYHMYFLTGSHFAQILKVALLSISVNLEA